MTIKTKFGTATITKKGYLYISSSKEGYHGKSLHRLVWEDFYSRPIPEGYDIHHMNGNKLDNRIQNLQCCKAKLHRAFHRKGKLVGEETKQKMSDAHKSKTLSKEHKENLSKARNSTGYLNVSKRVCKSCKQEFLYCYGYSVGGKRKSITSISLDKLKEKVLAKGLEWIELEEVKDCYT